MTTMDESRPFRVLQLTDPHLMAQADGVLLGVNTRNSLQAVIDEVLKVHGQPDLVLATGDLAQDSSEQAYHVFAEKLQAFPCPSAWLSGNHDHRVRLQEVAALYGADHRHIVRNGWQFILLDSSVAGKVYGELADSELEFLEQTLMQHPELPALVALHHHPVDIGSDWMEKIGLRNREALWRVIERFPQVRILLCGHVHQELDKEVNGVRLLATPSTCIQFTSGSSRFAVEPLSPGYRWFELRPDGNFHTEVRRAGNFNFDLDQSSTGY